MGVEGSVLGGITGGGWSWGSHRWSRRWNQIPVTIGQKIASQKLPTTEVTNSQLVKPISTIVQIGFVASQPTQEKKPLWCIFAGKKSTSTP
jgi:hypothetical protein